MFAELSIQYFIDLTHRNIYSQIKFTHSGILGRFVECFSLFLNIFGREPVRNVSTSQVRTQSREVSAPAYTGRLGFRCGRTDSEMIPVHFGNAFHSPHDSLRNRRQNSWNSVGHPDRLLKKKTRTHLNLWFLLGSPGKATKSCRHINVLLEEWQPRALLLFKME